MNFHFLSSLIISQYTMPTVKRKTTKSWRHPLRKPTARAVPSAVKQQANSDDGEFKNSSVLKTCYKLFTLQTASVKAK